MCRNIKTLYNFDPQVTDEELQNASEQFIRKITGFQKPSKANEAAFNEAVEKVTHTTRHLMDALVTNASPRNREEEAARARLRAMERFGST